MLKDAIGTDRSNKVVIVVELADKTRRAQITVNRSMKFSDLVKVCRKNWALPFGVDYNVASSKTGRQYLAQETLGPENVANGEHLFLLPFPVHG